jgi:hypothetical protein
MNKKYIIFLCAALTLMLSGCESCKGRLSGQGANSPAGVLVDKHIEYLKLTARQAFSQEDKANKAPEEIERAVAEIDKTGKDIKSSYVVKIKNSCKPEEIDATDKLLTCVNGAMTEASASQVEDFDGFIFEKCNTLEAPKTPECSKVITEFFEEFDKAKK